MTVLAEILVLGLVAYRVWRLIAVDCVSERPREWATRGRPGLESFLSCPWCAGFWVTAGVVAFAWTLGLLAGSAWLVIPASAVVVGFLGERL